MAEKGGRRHVSNWIRSVSFLPKISVLMVVPAGGDWAKWESFWIEWFGFDSLTNSTKGGEGVSGRPLSARVKAVLDRQRQKQPKRVKAFCRGCGKKLLRKPSRMKCKQIFCSNSCHLKKRHQDARADSIKHVLLLDFLGLPQYAISAITKKPRPTVNKWVNDDRYRTTEESEAGCIGTTASSLADRLNNILGHGAGADQATVRVVESSETPIQELPHRAEPRNAD